MTESKVPAPSEPGEDLEYDLAHEWAARPVAAAHIPATVYVATQTADQGGDYSYDLAHDVPGR